MYEGQTLVASEWVGSCYATLGRLVLVMLVVQATQQTLRTKQPA